jgi:hypothetical protein
MLTRPRTSALDYCGTVYSGERGLPVPTMRGDTLEDVEASFGFMWIVEQIQKTRDKSHYTHSLVSHLSVKPEKGRSAGGAIRQDEMSVYAAEESGLLKCADELRARSSITVVEVCDTCHLLVPLCTCSRPATSTPFALPLETVVTLLAGALYHSTSVEFHA